MENGRSLDKNRKNPPIKTFWSLAGLGMEFTGILLFFILGGSWLDTKFSLSPLLLLVGMVLGFGLGIFHILQRSKDV